ncbi:hypothetical protein [Candidatus Borreliella tachyglossi]|uniref:hypothetical protein n=1 Tax=Candidatus Borreliella tachyglossi TaxID=1964448 RepID=UPI004042707C
MRLKPILLTVSGVLAIIILTTVLNILFFKIILSDIKVDMYDKSMDVQIGSIATIKIGKDNGSFHVLTDSGLLGILKGYTGSVYFKDKDPNVVISHSKITSRAHSSFLNYGSFVIEDKSKDIKIVQREDVIIVQYESGGMSVVKIKGNSQKQAFIIEDGAYSSGEMDILSDTEKVEGKKQVLQARNTALRAQHNLGKEDLILEILRGRDNIKVINYYYAYPV